MAAIVASTLRRRTMQQKQFAEARQVADSIGDNTPSRTPSYYKLQSRSPQHAGSKGIKLYIDDFWPRCENPLETDLKLLRFESFETLIPQVNGWLQDNLDIEILKCETIEKRISSLEQLDSDSTMLIHKDPITVIYVKGLRIWYTYSRDCSKTALQNTIPLAIGYLNVVPKCLDSKAKYPVYEELPETFSAINNYMTEKPLDGKILTIESVSMKLPCKLWRAPEIDPDLTYMTDEYMHHVFLITRIFFLFGTPETELIGAQDFLPDFVYSSRCNGTCSVRPKYRPLSNAVRKATEWIQNARNIRVVNIQTVDTVFRDLPEKVHTGVSFMHRVDSCAMVRFLRISYARPSPQQKEEEERNRPEENGDVNKTLNVETTSTCSSTQQKDLYYSAPAGLAYKTFVPSAVKVGMCSGSPEYERFTSIWERSRAWLLCNERKVLSLETVYHPVNLVWHSQDGGETTSLCTNWIQTIQRTRYRQQLVQLIRVFVDGDYQEPSSEYLPMLPMVEEINDCRCLLM